MRPWEVAVGCFEASVGQEVVQQCLLHERGWEVDVAGK